jgi:hypothetical protein
MHFTIWGAGVRGKRIFEFIGQDKIIALVDSNSNLIGKDYKGTPIIDFETYKKYYSQYFIIISPQYYYEIVEFLKKHDIYNYFIVPECPPEVYMYRVFPLFKNFPLQYDTWKCNAIYGINLFSVLLYEYLEKNGCRNLYLIPQFEIEYKYLQTAKSKLQNCKIALLSDVEMKIDKMFLTIEKDHEKIKNGIKNNFIIENAFDYTDKIDAYYNPKIAMFKNTQKGRRCFIVATGPSLRIEDLECLHKNNELSISMNHIFCAFPNANWRPNYYVCQDRNFIRDYETEICKIDIENKFISDYYMPFWDIERTMYRFHGHVEEYLPNTPKFSTDFSRKSYDGYTVTYTCIQLAVYLGFSEIFLLGVDFNYSSYLSASENHFYKDYEKEKNKVSIVACQEILLAYQKARQYAEEHGIKIYNATRGGKLEVFERVNFDNLFRI